MISRASGSLTAIRALLFDGEKRLDAARRFLSSWATVRWGAVLLALGGAAEVSAGLFSGWISLREAASAYDSAGYYPQAAEWMYAVSAALRSAEVLLLSVGILGLYAALAKRRRWIGRLAAAGTLVAAMSGLGFCIGVLYQFLAQPVYYGSWGLLEVLFFGGYFGQTVGVTLLGIAALWARGLGPWRVLPLLVGVIGSPLAYYLLLTLSLGGDELGRVMDGGVVLSAVLFAAPAVLAGLGWVVVGIALFGAKRREAGFLAQERRGAEERNRSLARRLYEEAFGAGNPSVAEDLAARDLLDRRDGGRGPEGLKRRILDLHRAFPDLRLSIEEQTVDGDTVTTRCRLSGTDKGGVLWYPPTNRPATFPITYTDRFSGGKLVEHDGESDTEGLLQQLGLPGDRE